MEMYIYKAKPSGEVSRGEKMAFRGTDPQSYITEYTSVYEDEPKTRSQVRRGIQRARRRLLQGYLAHKKQRPPKTLQQDYDQGPMEALWGGGVFYERGTHIGEHPMHSEPP